MENGTNKPTWIGHRWWRFCCGKANLILLTAPGRVGERNRHSDGASPPKLVLLADLIPLLLHLGFRPGDKLSQRKWSQVRRVCRLSVDSLSYAFTALSRRNAVNNASFSQFLSNFFPSNKSVMAKGWLTVDTDLGLTILINSYLIQNTRLVSARQRQEIYALNKVMTRLENEKFSLIKWGIHLTILSFQTSGHFECITGARWLDVKEKTRIMVRRTYLCDRVTLCVCFRNFFFTYPVNFS